MPMSCFVIGPIGSEGSEPRIHADWLYHGIILPVFKDGFPDFLVERADTIATPGMVSSQIINRLHDAELVVADLSFHNANAFYEMSIRHNVGKPIIHMIRKGESIPFDVIPHRAIYFSNATPEEHDKARALLAPAVTAALDPNFKADNPILHARGRLELEKNASPEQFIFLDMLSNMERRIASIEQTSTLQKVATEEARYRYRVTLRKCSEKETTTFLAEMSAIFPAATIQARGTNGFLVHLVGLFTEAKKLEQFLQAHNLVQGFALIE